MGSLAHYMQETSADGFNLRDYIHEGIGQIWADSLEHPGTARRLGADRGTGRRRRHAGARRREHPDFLAGFDRVCEGGGVALVPTPLKNDTPATARGPWGNRRDRR